MSAAEPCDRELSNWQGRIASAAKNGGGLDEYHAALNWAKQGIPPDNGMGEKAKQEIREAAERHLADRYGLGVIEAIYGATFPEDDAVANNNKLDEGAIKIDDQDEITRLAKLSRIEYGRARKDAAKQLGITAGALDEEVRERRKQHLEESTPSAWPHWAVEPWPETVDSELLLQTLKERIRKHVVLTAN